MERGNSWIRWLGNASDHELEAFVAEVTETLPPDDPMIDEFRYWLHQFRATLRGENG